MKQPHTTARLLSNRKHVRLAHRLSWRARIKIPVLKGKKHLADKITARLLEMPAVTAAIIRMPTGSLILEHCNGPVNLDEVMQLIEKQLLLYQFNEAKAHEISDNTCRQSKDVEKAHVSGPVLLISGIYLLYLWIRRFFSPAKPAVLLSRVSRILGLPALTAIFLSLPILKKGLKSLARTGKPGMDLIITGILYLSILVSGAGTALVVFWLFNLSEWLEDRTCEKTRQAIRSMLQHDVREAWVVRDGVEVAIPVDQLTLGEIISLRFGNGIPVDGTIVEGEALINDTTMTGESFPVYKSKGDQVLAGTTVETGHIFVRVDSVGEETRLATIIRIIEAAESGKAPVQLSAQRFVEAIMPVSLTLFFGTLLFTGSLIRAIAMLIITCPCAIRLSAATALTASMGNAAKRGIFIKGGQYLELAGNIDVLVFDKTGTLTAGVPRVSRVVTLDEEFPRERILQLVASSQMPWKHPMTLAVAEKIRELELEIPSNEKTELIIGQGVKAQIDDREILVGSHYFMENCKVDHDAGHMEEQRMIKKGEIVLFVACDRRLIGLIGIEDRLKENAADILNALKTIGVRHIAMLTGDRRRIAESVSEQLPLLDEVRWKQSPEDKAAWIAKWKQEHPEDIIAMVGDGINDTPAFAHADLSFAMGETGADIAMEHANIVLQRSDLALVAQAMRLGKKTLAVIHENQVAVVGLNLTGVIFTALQWLSPFAGAFLHNLITLGAVSNSGRLLFYDPDSAFNCRSLQYIRGEEEAIFSHFN